jgi:excisionase family DNA binding protein
VSDPDLPDRSHPLGEPLLSADEVASYLGVDRATVYRLAGRRGGLPVVQVSRRVRRFRGEDVRAYLAARTVTPRGLWSTPQEPPAAPAPVLASVPASPPPRSPRSLFRGTS